MAIIREVIHNNVVQERERLLVDYKEAIKTSDWGSGEETWISVQTDDDLDVTFYFKTFYEARDPSYKVLRSHTYHTNEINEHDIQTHPSPIRHKVVAFKWEPNHMHVTPDQERSIREMVANGTYTEQEAKEVRDQLIFEAQRKAEGLE